MRLWAYYALHSFVNQLKKLFRTWVMVFLLVCVLFGVVIGLLAAFIDDNTGGDTPDDDPSSEVIPPDDPSSEVDPDAPSSPDDNAVSIFYDKDGNAVFVLDADHVVDLVVTAVIVFIFALIIMTMDKGSFFLPGDTMLLFPSPMTPQGVLFFRLSCLMGSMVFAGVYILFQLPNLIINAGLKAPAVISIVIAYVLCLVISVIFSVAVYIFSASDPKKSSAVKYALLALVFVAFAGSVAYSRMSGISSIWGGVMKFFSLKETRYFPMIGWLKGFVMYAVEANYVASAICLAATLAGAALMIFGIYKMKADFYEEAMAKSEEVAAALQAQKEKGSLFGSSKRKKDRGDRLKRDGFRRGSGANVYFFKEMYNRSRFAILGVFTKTSITYLVLGLGVTAVLRFMTDVRSMLPAAFVIAAFAFYRTIGNPLEKDIMLPYFSMIPAGAGEKLFWSMLAGVTNTALDAAVPVILSGIVMGESPLTVIGCLLLILSIDFYSTTAGTFIGISLPQNAGTTLKQLIQIMFLYFGLIPDIAIIAIAGVMGYMGLGLAIAAAANVGIGAVIFAFLPLFF